MAKIYITVLEAPHGRGEVFLDHRSIAVVNYVLTVEQEVALTEAPTGTGEVYGALRIAGQIKIISGRIFLEGDIKFNLQLADGRRFDFKASDRDVSASTYHVVNTDPRGFNQPS